MGGGQSKKASEEPIKAQQEVAPLAILRGQVKPNDLPYEHVAD